MFKEIAIVHVHVHVQLWVHVHVQSKLRTKCMYMFITNQKFFISLSTFINYGSMYLEHFNNLHHKQSTRAKSQENETDSAGFYKSFDFPSSRHGKIETVT